MRDSNRGETGFRPLLAILIVVTSVVGAIAAGIVAIAFATDDTRAEMSRLVFASILPLLGTWVGTVLAFYFARQNLEAATESTVRLSGLTTDSAKSVADVMIPRAQIVAFELKEGDSADSIKLNDLHTRMTTSGKSRMPILSPSGAALFVLRRQTIAEFAAGLAKNPADADKFKEDLADLLADAAMRKSVEAIAFVGPGDLIETARAKMGEVDSCNDVFVTKGGARDGAVLGWLTNTDLAKAE